MKNRMASLANPDNRDKLHFRKPVEEICVILGGNLCPLAAGAEMLCLPFM